MKNQPTKRDVLSVAVSPGVVVQIDRNERDADTRGLNLLAEYKLVAARADANKRDALIRQGIKAMIRRDDHDGFDAMMTSIDWSEMEEEDVRKLFECVMARVTPDSLDKIAAIAAHVLASDDMESAEVAS